MLKVVTIAALMLAATLAVVSVFADADAFGLTSEPARLLFSGGLGILALLCLLVGLLGGAVLLKRRFGG